MSITVPRFNRTIPDYSRIDTDYTSIITTEIIMDIENGNRVMERLHEKDHKLMEQNLTSAYIIIDRKSYMDLCAYNDNLLSHRFNPNPGESRWVNSMYLSGGEAKFIVLPQDKKRIQVIPKTEDVLFRMNR